MATHLSTCNLCEAHCGIVVETENNKVTKISGDKDDPFSHGYICPKARALEELHHDPDRLTEPLRRLPSGQWEKISWDSAFDFVGENLRSIQKMYGQDAVALYLGNPNVHNSTAALYLQALGELLGTKNKASATSLDQLPNMVANWALYGHQFMFAIPDVDRTQHMVILGANPLASNGSIMTAPNIKKRLRAISERGGKTVVIDPRRTQTAELCDEHFFIKPGTDAVLLLAWLHVLVREDKLNPGWLGPHLKGWETVKSLAGYYTPESAAGITGIPAKDIRRMALEFAAAERAVLYPRVGVSIHEFGGLCHYLTTLINIVTGNLDRPGGMMFTNPAIDLVDLLAKAGLKGTFQTYHSRVKGYPEFNGEIPAATLPDEILTEGKGQVRGMITAAGNPVLSAPNGGRFEKALAALDFMVSIDIYLNETTRFADIILPPTGPLERAQFDIIFPTLSVRNHVKYSEPVFQPGDHQRSDEQIYKELITRLMGEEGSLGRGMTRMILGAVDIETILAGALRIGPYGDKFNPFSSGLNLKKLKEMPHGIDLGPLTPCLPERLYTKDKKIDLDQPLFLNDIVRLKEVFPPGDAGPGNGAHKSLILIGRRDLRSNNSWMHNLPRLHGDKNRCYLYVHPDDAGPLKLLDGDTVKITSRVGSASVAIQLTDEVMPGVVSLPHGFGHHRDGIGIQYAAGKNAGVSINDITDNAHLDTLCGTAALNRTAVTLEKINSAGNGKATSGRDTQKERV